MTLWVGNETDQKATYTGELCGFNTGDFETKIIRGAKRDPSGIAWVISSDRDLVIYEKKVMAVGAFMHACASKHGLADVGIPEHSISAKMGPVPWQKSKWCCVQM